MGQYYLIVNLDGREVVDPTVCGRGAKLAELAANSNPLPLLLGHSRTPGRCDGDPDPEDPFIGPIAGRWAGQRVALIGDEHRCDGSGLPTHWEIQEHYTDISAAVARAWERFIDPPVYVLGWPGEGEGVF